MERGCLKRVTPVERPSDPAVSAPMLPALTPTAPICYVFPVAPSIILHH